MPLKHYNNQKPTIYLDKSHIVYGYWGSCINKDDIYKKYQELIFKISKEANLCFSMNHLLEFVNYGDERDRKLQFAWLDQLEWVFIRNEIDIKKIERSTLLYEATNLKYFDRSVFTNSMHDAFFSVIKVEQTSDLLKINTLSQCLEEFEKKPLSNINDYKKVMQVQSKKLQDNFNFIQRNPNIGIAEIRRQLKENHFIDLLNELLEDVLELKQLDDKVAKEYRSIMEKFFLDEEYKIQNMPYHFLSDEVTFNFKNYLGKKTDLDSNKNKKDIFSSYYDLKHIVGAAYCDIFTCDKRIGSYMINDLRTNMGKTKQIYGSVETVYTELKNQFEQAL